MATATEPVFTLIAYDRDGDDFTLKLPPSATTHAGFRKWVLSDDAPEKVPVTYLRGKITVDISKEVLQTHAAVKTAIGIELGAFVRDSDFGDFYINGVLVTNVDAAVSNNPDMVAISWESLSSEKVRYNSGRRGGEMEIVGSPDWILEIVSTGSVTKDYRDLRKTYHEAGVREYWIVDARGDDIVFQILHWRKSGYAAAPRGESGQRSRVFGRWFDLSRRRDRRGGWRYQLANVE